MNVVLIDLTLTSVVFELLSPVIKFNLSLTFNFNKCCIWIRGLSLWQQAGQNLTLTSVVFEYY